MEKRERRFWVSWTICALAVPLGAAPVALARPPAPGAALAARRMSRAAGGRVASDFSPRSGRVRFLSAPADSPIPVGSSGSAEERARAFLATYREAFGLDREVDLAVESASPPDELGIEHVRFQQMYRGLPITGAETVVHLRDDCVVAASSKTLADVAGLPTVALVSADEARIFARAALATRPGGSGATLGEPRLELLNRALLGARGPATYLAWFLEARATDVRDLVWIDARSGRVVLQFSQLADVRSRRVWDAASTSSLEPGSPTRTEGGPPAGGDAGADVNAAYDFTGDTYDYYAEVHGRDSYDDAGSVLKSTVRYCPSAAACPYENAFWNGERMVYGAGYPQADDVTAHELTHAVTESTANLFYYMQSGALDESYSDIFGETVDLWNGAGDDSVGVRWLIGEDLSGGAGRDMEDPNAFGDPARMGDFHLYCGDDYSFDQGGVHHNSGIPNRAYTLMVDGGSFNGRTVTGIGLTKAAKIEYRALTRYLVSASDFLDDDRALRQACLDLVGTFGVTAGDCAEVGKALDAVEMADPWACSPAQVAVSDLCPAGEAPEIWFFEDFEDAEPGLSECPADTMPADWCRNGPDSLLGAFATGGEHSLWGYDRPTAGAMWHYRDFPSMPPAGARMQFEHSYGFDNSGDTYLDGGEVWYATDGGHTFHQGGPLMEEGQYYIGSLSDCCGNPYAGLPAFVRDSWGYASTRLDLSSLSGTAFSYAFVVATDDAIDEYGWWIDDVRIYTCSSCPASRTLDAGNTGTAALYRASGSISAGDGFAVRPGEEVTLEAGDAVVLGDGFAASGRLVVVSGSASCP